MTDFTANFTLSQPDAINAVFKVITVTEAVGLRYNDLIDRPQVNGITLTDNKTSADLSLASASDLNAHVNNLNNPHQTTKTQVGLSNVDNTSDANKPISTSTNDALNTKVDKVAGKQLSTEDYTTAEKSKLAGIETGAQVNPDLTPYAKTTEVNTALSGKSEATHNHTLAGLSEKSYNSLTEKPTIPTQYTDAMAQSALTSQLSQKVDKSTGKSLVLDTDIAKIHEHSNRDILDAIAQAPLLPSNIKQGSNIIITTSGSDVTINGASQNYKAPYTITVGTGGDFAKLSDALAYAAIYSSSLITINILNNLTESAGITLTGWNTSSVLINGNGYSLTFSTGGFTLSNCSNITFQSLVINSISIFIITFLSSVVFKSCTIVNVDTNASNTRMVIAIDGLSNTVFSSCTFTTPTTHSSGRGLYLRGCCNVSLTGTTTINYLTGTNYAIGLESSTLILSGTLTINGKPSIATNSAFGIAGGTIIFEYGIVLNISNYYIGINAQCSSIVKSNIYGFTMNLTGVTTGCFPVKNTWGNYNSYIQIP